MVKLIVVALWATLQAVPLHEAPIVKQGAVGPVTLGASAESVYRAFRGRSRLIDLALEGHLSPALELTFPGGHTAGVVAELVPRGNSLIVYRISVTDPAIRTEKGIGVGSTVDELRRAYRVEGKGSGEGRLFLMVEELGASFELDTRERGFETLWSIPDPQALPGDVKIRSILIRGAGHRR